MEDTLSWDRYLPYMQNAAVQLMRRSPNAGFDPSSLAQTAIIEAWRCRAKFRGESEEAFLAWMRGILANVVRSAARQQTTNQERSGQSVEDGGTDHHPTLVYNDPIASLDENETLDRVWQSMEVLPDDYRRVLQWRHQEGLTIREIASRLDRTEPAVRMLWVRALRELRRLVHRAGD